MFYFRWECNFKKLMKQAVIEIAVGHCLIKLEINHRGIS